MEEITQDRQESSDKLKCKGCLSKKRRTSISCVLSSKNVDQERKRSPMQRQSTSPEKNSIEELVAKRDSAGENPRESGGLLESANVSHQRAGSTRCVSGKISTNQGNFGLLRRVVQRKRGGNSSRPGKSLPLNATFRVHQKGEIEHYESDSAKSEKNTPRKLSVDLDLTKNGRKFRHASVTVLKKGKFITDILINDHSENKENIKQGFRRVSVSNTKPAEEPDENFLPRGQNQCSDISVSCNRRYSLDPTCVSEFTLGVKVGKERRRSTICVVPKARENGENTTKILRKGLIKLHICSSHRNNTVGNSPREGYAAAINKSGQSKAFLGATEVTNTCEQIIVQDLSSKNFRSKITHRGSKTDSIERRRSVSKQSSVSSSSSGKDDVSPTFLETTKNSNGLKEYKSNVERKSMPPRKSPTIKIMGVKLSKALKSKLDMQETNTDKRGIWRALEKPSHNVALYIKPSSAGNNEKNELPLRKVDASEAIGKNGYRNKTKSFNKLNIRYTFSPRRGKNAVSVNAKREKGNPTICDVPKGIEELKQRSSELFEEHEVLNNARRHFLKKMEFTKSTCGVSEGEKISNAGDSSSSDQPGIEDVLRTSYNTRNLDAENAIASKKVTADIVSQESPDLPCVVPQNEKIPNAGELVSSDQFELEEVFVNSSFFTKKMNPESKKVAVTTKRRKSRDLERLFSTTSSSTEENISETRGGCRESVSLTGRNNRSSPRFSNILKNEIPIYTACLHEVDIPTGSGSRRINKAVKPKKRQCAAKKTQPNRNPVETIFSKKSFNDVTSFSSSDDTLSPKPRYRRGTAKRKIKLSVATREFSNEGELLPGKNAQTKSTVRRNLLTETNEFSSGSLLFRDIGKLKCKRPKNSSAKRKKKSQNFNPDSYWDSTPEVQKPSPRSRKKQKEFPAKIPEHLIDPEQLEIIKKYYLDQTVHNGRHLLETIFETNGKKLMGIRKFRRYINFNDFNNSLKVRKRQLRAKKVNPGFSINNLNSKPMDVLLEKLSDLSD